jgi:hypothetical protein
MSTEDDNAEVSDNGDAKKMSTASVSTPDGGTRARA